MTQYIEEHVFRGCHQDPKPYFNYDASTNIVTKTFNDNTIKANPLNFLMVNDTFHDLVNPRGTYNPSVFINGPLNYLLTSTYFEGGDNVKKYEAGINFPEYQKLTGRFEPKVAKSFEINMGLQTADTFITYEDILQYVGILGNQITINDQDFLKKVIEANGSIAISVDSSESTTFSSYIENKNMTDHERNEAYLKISYFIRWYLHSNLQPQGMSREPMKILFDAGSSFLKEFFSAEGSMVKPFVAIPCILDSASTSTEKLDPTLDFHFEELTAEQVVPIVSNYFSCDKYFFCYLPNDGVVNSVTNTKYDLNTLYGFSLAIIKIPQEEENAIKIAINSVRTIPDIKSPDYLEACKQIHSYINENTNKIVARYYFGQVKNDKGDNSSCGTCGAGVPYIGRVINKIKDLKETTVPAPVKFSPIPPEQPDGNLNTLKAGLNSLKINASEPLGGRIPFSDARILKIFCNNDGNITISEDDLYSLFQILADYKRTGDYQQAYTVLKAILTGAGDNSEFFTFCSGDELSALIGRLLGVPTIYQTASGAQCRLYRGRLFTGTEIDKIKYELTNDKNIIGKYCGSIIKKINFLRIFIDHNYNDNIVLREKLIKFIEILKGEITDPPIINEKQMNTFFKLISVRNAYNKLNEIIKLSNLLSREFFASSPAPDADASDNTVSTILTLCDKMRKIDINTIEEENDPKITQIKDALLEVSKFEETINGFKIYNFIEDNFPQYFNNITNQPELISYDDKDKKTGVTIQLISVKNLKIPLLGINFFSNKVRSVSSLFSTYNTINSNTAQVKVGRNQRTKAVTENKIRLQKIEFLNGYNEFIDSCKFLKKEDGFKIESFDAFTTDFMGDKVNSVLSTFPEPAVKDRDELINKLDVVAREFTQEVSERQREASAAAVETTSGVPLGEEEKAKPQGNNKEEEQKGGLTGGNDESTYIQQGGATPPEIAENKRKILNDVKKLLLNLYNKCTNYIKNVQTDPEIQQDLIFKQFLNEISRIYATNEFCYQLLFQEADVEEENTIDNINIGFLTGLKLITNQYTYADFGYTQLDQRPENYDENSIVYKNISINFLLNKLLIFGSTQNFTLSDIKTLLFLLGLSEYTPPLPADAAADPDGDVVDTTAAPTAQPSDAAVVDTTAQPSADAAAPAPAPVSATAPDAEVDNGLLDLINTYFVETQKLEEVLLITDQYRDGIPESLPLVSVYPTNTLNIDVSCIQENNNKISGIFAIIVLSIMEVLYYGSKNGEIYMFNKPYIDTKIFQKGTTVTTLSVVHYNDSSIEYMNQLGTRLNKVIDNVGSTIGCESSKGPSLRQNPTQSAKKSGEVDSGTGKGVALPPGRGTHKGFASKGGKQRKTIKKNKTRTNTKTRKMRKIKKHKFTKRMKKNNNHKRSRK
jgi:hypothetical protein